MTVTRVQFRSEVSLKGRKLGGYASVFDQSADLGSMGNERMAATAFDAALKTSDTRSLWNHEPSYLLGRVSAGTLRLSTDAHGLEYEVDLPDTTYARDLSELVERGDVTGASFGFVIGDATWDERHTTRTHTSVDELVDVSPVTYPAYDGASTETRSLPLTAGLRRSQLIRARARVHLKG